MVTAQPRLEVAHHGTLKVELSRPPTQLAAHRAQIAGVLGKALPDDVAAFYGEGDGLTFAATRRGKPVGLPDTIVPLMAMFDDFKPHRQFRSATAYERAADKGEVLELALCGETWADDFELAGRDGLAQLNTLLRAKLLVRIAGKSEAVVIDFAPAGAAGKKPPVYQLGLAYQGNQYHPLTLTFPAFLDTFARFGASGWYYAYLTKRSLGSMNIDPRTTIAASLEPFRAAHPDQVAALLARADKLVA